MKQQRWEESEKKEKKEYQRRKESEERRCRWAKSKKGREPLCFSNDLTCGFGGLKSRLAKTAGAEPSGQMPSGQMRDEKLHAFVARSTCRSQTVQTTIGSDHFWKLRCRKSAHHGGAKHMSKSKCTKHRMYAPLLDVEASFGVAGARDCAPCQK